MNCSVFEVFRIGIGPSSSHHRDCTRRAGDRLLLGVGVRRGGAVTAAQCACEDRR